MFMIELAVLNIQLSCVIFITISSVIGITWLIVAGVAYCPCALGILINKGFRLERGGKLV